MEALEQPDERIDEEYPQEYLEPNIREGPRKTVVRAYSYLVSAILKVDLDSALVEGSG